MAHKVKALVRDPNLITIAQQTHYGVAKMGRPSRPFVSSILQMVGHSEKMWVYFGGPF